jgi:hypothetical protein
MINAYKLKYIPATDTKGASYKVTRIDDDTAYKLSYDHSVPYDYSVSDPAKHAIHKAFGEDVEKIEYVGQLSILERLYAVHH